MPTYRMLLEYEGTRYHGWQVQENARSVAGELRAAIHRAGADVVELGGSGRTDAGVHALGQSAHLRLRREVDPVPFRGALNEGLPADIHVLSLQRAPDSFHARHGATQRVYLYQISRRRSAFGKRFVWWVRRPLDADRMLREAARLEGRHDFALLCERAKEQPSTVVQVDRAEVAESGDLILIRISASHFLWKMVRRIVGVLARVGTGESRPGAIGDLLGGALPAGAQEGIGRWTAPASGLFLEHVVYPGEPGPGPLAPAFPVASEPRAPGGPAGAR